MSAQILRARGAEASCKFWNFGGAQYEQSFLVGTHCAGESSTFFQCSNQCGHLSPSLGDFPIPTKVQRAPEFLLTWEHLGSRRPFLVSPPPILGRKHRTARRLCQIDGLRVTATDGANFELQPMLSFTIGGQGAAGQLHRDRPAHVSEEAEMPHELSGDGGYRTHDPAFIKNPL